MSSTGKQMARRWWLVPVLVIVVGGSVATNLGDRGHAGPEPGTAGSVAAVALAVLAALLLFVVDQWPGWVVVVGGLVGGYFALGGENGPIFFTVVVAAFLLATCRPWPNWLWPLVGNAVLVWSGLLVRGLRWEDQFTVGLWQSVGVGALVAAAAAIGTSTRSRAAAREASARRMATEEQLRMARDLHDGVGHGLAVIAMQSGVALHVLDRDPAAARAALEAIRDTSREALESLRSELSTMTGEAPRSPRRGLADLDQLVDRVSSADLEVRVSNAAGELPADVDAAAYAIVQEALTNVLRHAGADRVEVRLERAGDVLEIVVRDDGHSMAAAASSGGFPDDDRASDGQTDVMEAMGMGIRGMRARAEALGGTLAAGPSDGGFEVRARLEVDR